MRQMGQLEVHIPAIRYLLAVARGDDVLTQMESVTRRKRLVDAIVALSLRGAQLRPLLLIYEDLHWIDSSTEACLSALLEAVAGAPMLLLLDQSSRRHPAVWQSQLFYHPGAAEAVVSTPQ
jgi:predicted ATPase